MNLRERRLLRSAIYCAIMNERALIDAYGGKGPVAAKSLRRIAAWKRLAQKYPVSPHETPEAKHGR